MYSYVKSTRPSLLLGPIQPSETVCGFIVGLSRGARWILPYGGRTYGSTRGNHVGLYGCVLLPGISLKIPIKFHWGVTSWSQLHATILIMEPNIESATKSYSARWHHDRQFICQAQAKSIQLLPGSPLSGRHAIQQSIWSYKKYLSCFVFPATSAQNRCMDASRTLWLGLNLDYWDMALPGYPPAHELPQTYPLDPMLLWN